MPCCLRLFAIKVAPSISLMLLSCLLWRRPAIMIRLAGRGNPRGADYAVPPGLDRGRGRFCAAAPPRQRIGRPPLSSRGRRAAPNRQAVQLIEQGASEDRQEEGRRNAPSAQEAAYRVLSLLTTTRIALADCSIDRTGSQ